MKGFFSRVNVPTLVAVFVGIIIDKKVGITDKIIARI